MKKTDVLKRALAKLEASRGRLTPEIVVRAASDKRSPLHSHFVWDDRIAAHRHRLDTARELITTYVTVMVVTHKQQVTVPYYVRDPSLPSKVPGYVRTESERTREHAEMIIRDEMTRIVGCINRARNLAVVLDEQHPGIASDLEMMLETTMMVKAVIDGGEARTVPGGMRRGKARVRQDAPRPQA